MGPFMIFVGIAAIIFVIKYFNYKKQLLDRIALNPEEVKILGTIDTTSGSALRWGLLFIGIALGIILGAFFYKFSLFDDQIFAYLTGIFLAGGIALLIGYAIENKK